MTLKTKAKIVGIKNGKNILVIFNRTPFYVESGGQVDDLGKISLLIKSYNIVDVAKIDNLVIHV